MTILAGLDIGGTKCATVLGTPDAKVLARRVFDTRAQGDWRAVLTRMAEDIRAMAGQMGLRADELAAAGISCGGPLDPDAGVVLSPPNLPGWDAVPAQRIISEALGIPTQLRNDADACALAEWRYGAGRGCHSMMFLTFGTGMGAGLILGGRLYTGACAMAGEVGHIRLAQDGPIGFGKAGSFEGFCSGGGLAQQGRAVAQAALAAGRPLVWCPDHDALARISAKSIAQAAFVGDADALAIFAACGRRLGQALSLFVDILNPQRIVIGSIFQRCEALLSPEMQRVMQAECIPRNLAHCQVVPAQLGDSIGDAAALSVALLALEATP